MNWDELIEYNRRWVELHKDNAHQAEAAKRIAVIIDKIDQLRTDEAVERVATVMAEVTGEPRAGRFERTMARAAITALLGGD